MVYELKPLFRERLEKLLPNKEDFAKFELIIHTQPRNFIRCNTLKISPESLMQRLNKKWQVQQPFPEYPEIMIIESKLLPGELGNALEHVLGFYYVQEISSMLPILALNPQPDELILDLFASPGSKTTQMASRMLNQGTIIANELKLDRIKPLSANLERCAVTNTIISRKDAVDFCLKLSQKQFKFDKILLDAPCSGEGTLRSSPKTFITWNKKVIDRLSRQQKKFLVFALKCLKVGGTLVYSTCTLAPEENEAIVSFALNNFPLRIESISLPIKSRSGILEWENEQFNPQTQKACRIYPHDNDSEGFFLAKFTLMEEVK